MPGTDAEKVLEELRERAGAVAAALVTKDGNIVASDVARAESRDVVGVLAATVLGAAGAVGAELALGKPVCVVVHTEAGRLTIVDAGPRLLAVLAAPNGKETDALAADTRTIVSRLDP
jgi:predicted regulator of Ras-like GTPase activity (Roadblock/LC7/MglB family)